MSAWLILVVMVIYFVIAVDLFRAGNMGLSLTFFGYGLSNIGLWAAAR